MGYVVRPGDIVKSTAHRYTIIREMNKGGFADAYEAQDENGITVFLKQYKSPSKLVPWFKNYFKYEDELNARLRNDPVLKSASIYANEVFLGKPYKSDGHTPWTRNDSIFQVFPFVKGNTNLDDMIKKDFTEYDWEKRLYACAVFAFAMRKLHDVDVIHCDLKPENVQIKLDPTIAIKYRPLLIDMDWSILSDKTAPWNGYQGYVGTVGYNSPEHLRGEIPLEASDVFTFAIIICQVLAGRHPFNSHLAADDLTEYVLSGTNDFTKSGKIPFKDYVTPKFHDLIVNALNVDPKKRPTMTEIHTELMSMCKNHGKPDTSNDPNYSIMNGIKKVGSFLFGSSKKEEICDPISGEKPKPIVKPETLVERPVAAPRAIKPADIPVKKAKTGAKVKLTGDVGAISTAASFAFDQNTLKRVSSQAKYADATCQFTISPAEDKWYISTNDSAANYTTINGKVLNSSKELVELHDSDVVALQGRSSGKVAMEIKINIV